MAAMPPMQALWKLVRAKPVRLHSETLSQKPQSEQSKNQNLPQNLKMFLFLDVIRDCK
jgi:hypothetical protein